MNQFTTEIDVFVASIRGNVVRPGDDSYDDARAIYNGMIDKKPSMIVQVSDVADVISAVKFCAENKISIAVRSGGHNGKCFASNACFCQKYRHFLVNVNFLNQMDLPTASSFLSVIRSWPIDGRWWCCY